MVGLTYISHPQPEPKRRGEETAAGPHQGSRRGFVHWTTICISCCTDHVRERGGPLSTSEKVRQIQWGADTSQSMSGPTCCLLDQLRSNQCLERGSVTDASQTVSRFLLVVWMQKCHQGRTRLGCIWDDRKRLRIRRGNLRRELRRRCTICLIYDQYWEIDS